MWVRSDYGPQSPAQSYANQPPIVAVSHTYDRMSNKLTTADARPGARLPFRDRVFTYDGLNRLVDEARTPVPTSGYTEQQLAKAWDLDMLGNWNSLVRDADEDGSFTDFEGANHTDGRRHNAANEIESNGLVSDPNFDREVISGGSPAASRYHQHRYDHAGNMTDQRTAAAVPVGGGLMAGLRMGYDAWNRLVTTEYTSPLGASDVSAYTYNALGWRTSKTADATKGAYDGVMEQKRVFVYDASWRIIEEHVDVDFDTNPGADWVSQHFWGLRYIDDLVAKRVDRDADGDWSDASQWYFITDSQFSVVAVLDWEKHLWERIEYDAYGNARHRYAGDVTGDGRYDFFDLAALGGESAIGDANYHADFDVNFDGQVGLSTGTTDVSVITHAGRNGEMSTALPGGWIGDPSSEVGPDNSIGYAGYVFNPEREDYTVRFRVYAPELGRWRQRDPIGYAEGQHRMAYVASRPTEYIDPSGLTADPNDKGFTVGSRNTHLDDPLEKFFADTMGGHVDIYYNGGLVRTGRGGKTAIPNSPAPPGTTFSPLTRKNKGILWQDPSHEGPPVPCSRATQSQIAHCLANYPPLVGPQTSTNNCQTDIKTATEACCLSGFSSPSTILKDIEDTVGPKVTPVFLRILHYLI